MDKINARQVATLWLTAFVALLMYVFPPVGRVGPSGLVSPKGFVYLTKIPDDFVVDYKRLLFQLFLAALLAVCLILSNRGSYSPELRRGRLLAGLAVLGGGFGIFAWWLQSAPVNYPGRGVEWHPRILYVGDARLVAAVDMRVQLLGAILIALGVYLTLTALGSRSNP